MGKAQRMHLFSDSGERQEDAARQGDQFSPLRACVVSKAKCRKIGGVEGRNSFILISERGLDGRDGSDLSIFTTKAEAGLNSCWTQSERRMWHLSGLFRPTPCSHANKLLPTYMKTNSKFLSHFTLLSWSWFNDLCVSQHVTKDFLKTPCTPTVHMATFTQSPHLSLYLRSTDANWHLSYQCTSVLSKTTLSCLCIGTRHRLWHSNVWHGASTWRLSVSDAFMLNSHLTSACSPSGLSPSSHSSTMWFISTLSIEHNVHICKYDT